VKIQWFGQACFCITSPTGLKLITDPYQTGLSPRFLYAPVDASADIVTVSHSHGDHDNVAAVSGNPVVVRTPGISNVKGLEIKGVMTFHDKVKGAELGANIIFVFQMDGLRLAHLGDLGHPLDSAQIAELKRHRYPVCSCRRRESSGFSGCHQFVAAIKTAPRHPHAFFHYSLLIPKIQSRRPGPSRPKF